MKRIEDKIFILRKIRHGESDLILHCLDSSGSRLNLIAKGAIRSRRRFGGGILEPTHFLKVNYQVRFKSDGDSLHWLEEAELLRDFPLLKSDYDRLDLAFDFLRTLLQVSREGIEDGEEVFQLLGHALASAESVQNLNLLRCLFELKLLWLQGVLSEDLQKHRLLKASMSEVDRVSQEGLGIDQLKPQVRFQLDSFLENRF